MGIGRLGLGAVLANGKMKLASTAKLDKALFSNPNLTELSQNLSSNEEVKQFLGLFGKYAKDVKIDPTHSYKYINGHGAAQIFDKTTQEAVIGVTAKVSRPITKFVKYLLKR